MIAGAMAPKGSGAPSPGLLKSIEEATDPILADFLAATYVPGIDAFSAEVDSSSAASAGSDGVYTGAGSDNFLSRGIAAVGDFLGFDGEFGWQGPAGRDLSVGGIRDAFRVAFGDVDLTVAVPEMELMSTDARAPRSAIKAAEAAVFAWEGPAGLVGSVQPTGQYTPGDPFRSHERLECLAWQTDGRSVRWRSL